MYQNFKCGKKFAIFCSVICGLQVTSALAIDINGDYKSDSNLISLRVITLDAKNGDTTEAAAQVTTSNGRGCAGDVSGIGKVTGSVLQFNSYTTFTSKCTITVKFNKDGSAANITEKGCLDWHGVQCSFEGRVSKRE